MPVHWTISHPARLVVAVTKDEVRVEDIEKYFAGVTAEGAMAYRKIFEITATPMALSAENLRALGQRVVLYAEHGQVGRWPSSRARKRAMPRRSSSLPRQPLGDPYGSSGNCMPRAVGSTSRRPSAN